MKPGEGQGLETQGEFQMKKILIVTVVVFIAEKVVEIFPVLHAVENTGLIPISEQNLETPVNLSHGKPQGGYRIDDQVVAEGFEFFSIQ